MDILHQVTPEQVQNAVLISLITLFSYAVYWYAYGRFQFFKKRGIPGPEPGLFFGNMLQFRLTDPETIFQKFDKLCKEYPGVFGLYFGGAPSFVIRDVNMLKEVFQGKFDCFRDRLMYLDRPYPQHLMLGWLTNPHWKRLRTKLGPAFTLSKIKATTPIHNKACDTFLQIIEEKVKNKEQIDLKTIGTGYSTEIILSAAFGLEGKSQSDINRKIVKYGHDFFQGYGTLWMIMQWFPFAEHYMRFIPSNISRSIKKVQKDIENLISERKKEGHRFTDILQFMIDTQKNGEDGLTDDEIFGSSANFMAAGQETAGTTITACWFMLAKHPDVQEKVFEEVSKIWKDQSKPLTYEEVEQMTYVDQVVKESLRLNPPATYNMRACKKDCEVQGLKVPKGTYVIVPIYTIHRSPEAYKKPNEFDPEHFSEEAIKNRDDLYFMPFGAGPRLCLGYKFALLEVKTAVARCIARYKIETTEKTPDSIVYLQRLTAIPSNELWVKFSKRTK